MNRSVKIMIGIFSAIIIVLLSLLLYVLVFGGNVSFIEKRFEAKLINTQNVSLEGVSTISVDGYSGDVVLISGENDEIVIKEYGALMKKDTFVEVSKKGTEVLLKEDKNAFPKFIVLGSNYHKMEVYLPASYTGEMHVKTSSGDVESKMDLTLSACTMETSSGDIVIKKIEGDARLTISSGDIDIQNGNGDIVAKANSGDIEILHVNGNKKIETSSGSITVEEGKGDVSASSNSGDMDVNAIEGSLDLKTSSGYVNSEKLHGHATISSSSGDISVSFDTIDGDINCETSSGTIDCIVPKNISFHFDAKTSSGDIEAYFDDHISYNKKGNQANGDIGDTKEWTMKITTSSGDIQIHEK